MLLNSAYFSNLYFLYHASFQDLKWSGSNGGNTSIVHKFIKLSLLTATFYHFLWLRSFQRTYSCSWPYAASCNILVILSLTVYTTNLQLPSTSGGHALHQQPANEPCCGNKRSTLTAITAGVSFNGRTFTLNFVQNSSLAQKLKERTDWRQTHA